MTTDATFKRYATPQAKAAVAKQHAERLQSNRQTYDRYIAEMKDILAQGFPIEILTGPCSPMTVSDAKSLRVYAHKLWAWMTA